MKKNLVALTVAGIASIYAINQYNRTTTQVAPQSMEVPNTAEKADSPEEIHRQNEEYKQSQLALRQPTKLVLNETSNRAKYTITSSLANYDLFFPEEASDLYKSIEGILLKEGAKSSADARYFGGRILGFGPLVIEQITGDYSMLGTDITINYYADRGNSSKRIDAVVFAPNGQVPGKVKNTLRDAFGQEVLLRREKTQ